jgi:hypothetical protein
MPLRSVESDQAHRPLHPPAPSVISDMAPIAAVVRYPTRGTSTAHTLSSFAVSQSQTSVPSRSMAKIEYPRPWKHDHRSARIIICPRRVDRHRRPRDSFHVYVRLTSSPPDGYLRMSRRWLPDSRLRPQTTNRKNKTESKNQRHYDESPTAQDNGAAFTDQKDIQSATISRINVRLALPPEVSISHWRGALSRMPTIHPCVTGSAAEYP